MQKNSNHHALHRSQIGLSQGHSLGHWYRLEPDVRILGCCGTYKPSQKTRSESNKTWKNVLTGRCQTQLHQKSLTDNAVTDWEFQIINSELEKCFQLKEAVRAKLKVKTGLRPNIEKWKQQIRNELQKTILRAGWFPFTNPNVF